VQWLAKHAPQDAAAARPVPVLLAEACYAGAVELYTEPPPLASSPGERPRAGAVARWQAARQPNLTNLRHEPLRLDDPHALALLAAMDGSRTRDDLAAVLGARLAEDERAQAGERVATYLSQFTLHGLLAA